MNIIKEIVYLRFAVDKAPKSKLNYALFNY